MVVHTSTGNLGIGLCNAPRQTRMAHRYGPGYCHDSASRKGADSGLADTQQTKQDLHSPAPPLPPGESRGLGGGPGASTACQGNDSDGVATNPRHRGALAPAC